MIQTCSQTGWKSKEQMVSIILSSEAKAELRRLQH